MQLTIAKLVRIHNVHNDAVYAYHANMSLMTFSIDFVNNKEEKEEEYIHSVEISGFFCHSDFT